MVPHSRGMLLRDERHWLDRAEEVETVAEMMTDIQARDSMLRVAEEYRQMAEHRRKTK